MSQSDPSSGKSVTLCMAPDQRSGDSAILEHLDGTPRVHHDRAYTAVTNSPPLDEQHAHLRTTQALGGSKPLPHGTDPSDRFAPTAYYLARRPQPGDTTHAVASPLNVIRNTAQPFRVADPAKPYPPQPI
ncbi:linear amide C-N hydrolase [Streptomyces poriferorum]|uniref:Linear amide C-N hydrolase n=1 Tax=Streptomyces poriferorum TaxID=2798799 RepID=A0ABY9IK12_9ACTN|nr:MULTISPECIES: linear amide C-N hydrolase [unclassified Streptomyces]MDP5315728.1 linear amide C-N hydrolase [Streptomyces sp. Alt4]WLQ54091.1 linear amide C-N hydrolase [Streptomyces sp. Alt2]